MFGLFKKRHTVFFAHLKSPNGIEHHRIIRFVGKRNCSDFFEWLVEKQDELPNNTIVVTCNMFTK